MYTKENPKNKRHIGRAGRTNNFAKSWLPGASGSRSVRRRVHAILRNACRALGLKRGKGLGMLGVGNQVTGAAVIAAMLTGFAPQASADGNGIFINDNSDTKCQHVAVEDPGWKIPFISDALGYLGQWLSFEVKNGAIENPVRCAPWGRDAQVEKDVVGETGDLAYKAGDIVKNTKESQTNRVLFYGSDSIPGADSLSLGGELYVNSGKIGLGGGNIDGAMVIGNPTVSTRDAAGNLVKKNRILAAGETFALKSNGTNVVQRYKKIGDNYVANDQGDYVYNNGKVPFNALDSSTWDGKKELGYELDTKVEYAESKTGTTATGQNAMAFGNNAIAKGENAVAFGPGAQSLHANSVALGAGSVTSGANQVSVGAPGKERTIANIAPGKIAKGSTDAVNGGQIFDLSGLGGGNGLVQQDAVTKDLSVGKDTGGKALDVKGSEGTRLIRGVTAGDLRKGSDEVATAGQVFDTNETVGKIGTQVTNNTTKIEKFENGTIGLVQQADAKAAVTVAKGTGGKTVNIAGTDGLRTIDGLHGGELTKGATQAATTGQVFDTNETVENIDKRVVENTNNISTINTSVKNIESGATGLVKHDAAGKKITVAADKDVATVDISGLNGQTRLMTGLKDATLAAGSHDAVTGGQLFTTNENVRKNSETIITHTTAINGLDGKIAGLKGDSLQWDATAGAFSAKHGTAAVNRITNVASGALTAKSSDAVNGSQLFTVKGDITTINTAVTNLNNGTTGLVKYDSAGKKITVAADKDATTIDLSGPNGQTRLVTGLTNGIGASDAATFGQLKGASQSVATALGGGVSVNVDGSITAPSFRIQNTEKTSVGDAFTALDTQVTTNTTDISTLTENIGNGALGLVQQSEKGKDLTVGKDTDGEVVDFRGAIVGDSRLTRKLTGLSEGAFSNKSQDAVTGAQLWLQGAGVARALGGNAGFNEFGRMVLPTYTLSSIAADGTTAEAAYVGVEPALKSLDANVKGINTRVLENTQNINSINTTINELNTGTAGLVQQADENAVVTVAKDSLGNAMDVSGKGGRLRKVTGVAEGVVSDKSTDALTGSQLFKTNSSITAALGGGAKLNPDGTIAGPTYKIQGQDKSNVGDAFATLDGQVTRNTENITTVTTNVGNITKEISLLSTDSLKWNAEKDAFSAQRGTGAAAKASRITDVADGTNDTDAINLKQLKSRLQTAGTDALNGVGDNAVRYAWDDKNKNGVVDDGELTTAELKLKGSKDASGKDIGTKLGNVGDGEISATSLQAVNGSQLNTTNNAIIGALGGGSTFINGVFNAPNYALDTHDTGGKSSTVNINNVGDALAALNGNDKVFNDRFAGVDNRLASLDKKVDYLDRHTLQSDKDGNFSAHPAISGLNKTPVAKLTGTGSPASSPNTLADTVTLRSADIAAPTASGGGTLKVTGLKDGEVSETSTDAVTGAQLNTTNKKLDGLGDAAVKMVVGPNGEKTNVLKLEGGDPNAPVLIKNVADARDGTDGVNKNQLDGVENKFVEQTNTINEQVRTIRTEIQTASTTTLDEANSHTNRKFNDAKDYTDKQFNKLSSDIGVARKEAHQAAAIGLAAASLRYDDTPGKISVATEVRQPWPSVLATPAKAARFVPTSRAPSVVRVSASVQVSASRSIKAEREYRDQSSYKIAALDNLPVPVRWFLSHRTGAVVPCIYHQAVGGGYPRRCRTRSLSPHDPALRKLGIAVR
ncbi:trimeric autotransporter adhesin [Phyllobacterium bourgognense]|uniref:Trimeric autotransporter adhesin n=1 Tax=Phyllobacterium bourgognense TaxID=314236 RepID=A0A368YJN6_9HYPH|nr:hypothetical protein [Phyllobacterium bourgognense]RCW79526.1 trimeric autotransporter adhesin [Phyllobacterium bourgognense]